MRFLLVFIPVILFGATGITAQPRHSHDEVFAVTGKIDADERSGKIPAAFALKQKVLLLRDPSKMDSRYRPD